MATKAQISKPPRRGRPNAERAAAIDKLVIATARRRFLELGYEAVALEAIAKEAGISKGTLYARHPTKEALFLAVWEQAVRQWSQAAARDDYLLTDSVVERLRHHAHTIARSLRDPETQAFQRLILGNAPRFPTIAREIHHIGFQYIAQIVARDMSEAAARDGKPVTHPARTAEAFVASVTGWMIQRVLVSDVSEQDAIDHADRVVDIFMSGREAW